MPSDPTMRVIGSHAISTTPLSAPFVLVVVGFGFVVVMVGGPPGAMGQAIGVWETRGGGGRDHHGGW
jgi:hypothetical protein